MEEQGSSSSSSSPPPALSSPPVSSSSHPLSPLSSSSLYSPNLSMKMLVKNLLDILENQEVSLFSISSDDVTPTVRAHLQAAKTSNMRAKDLVVSLLSNPEPPLDALYGDTVSSGNGRVVSMPYPSSSSPPRNPHRYSLDASTLLPNSDSYSSCLSSSISAPPTMSPAIRASPSSSSSSSSSSPSRRSVPPPTTPPRQLSSLSLSSSAIPYHSPSSISLPPSPSSTPSSPSFASSAANEGILPKKSKKNFLRRYTESKLSRSAEIQSKPPRRRFTLFQSDNTKLSLSSSPSSPVPAAHAQPPPSPSNAATMRKTHSLPVASAIASASAPASASGSGSSSASTSPPQSPNARAGETQGHAFIAASPSKKGERSGYPLMHEQSKLLFARKLESLRGPQGDVY